jgi:tape measure domain-containing protein
MSSDSEIVIAIRGETSGGKTVKRTLDDIKQSGRQAQSGMNDLRSEINRTDGAARLLSNTMRLLGVSFGLRQIQQLTDAYTNIQNRLRLVTGSASELKDVYNQLLQISQETRSDLSATVTLYQRLTFATRDLGISQSEILLFTEQLNKQLLVGGLAAQEAAATVFQLTQAFNKGKLDGDEFRTVLEAAPPILEALQKHLNKTKGEILAMSAAGQIGPAELIDSINAMADVTDKRFESLGMTFSQAMTVLKNGLIDSIGELDNAIGGSEKLTFAIVKMGDVLQVVMNDLAAVIHAMKGLFTDIVGSVVGLTTTMLNSIEKIVNTGIEGINRFRKDKISPLELTGGLSSVDIFAAQTDMSGQNYQSAGQSLNKANAATARFFGMSGYDQPRQPLIKGNRTPSNTAASDEIIKQQKAINKVTDSLRFQIEQLKRSNTEQAIYNNLKSAGVGLDSAAGQNIARLTQEYELNSEQLERQKRIFDGLVGVTEGFFKSAIQGADGFKGALRGLVGQLADLVFQMTVIEPIKNNLFGGSGGGGGLFSSLFSKVVSGFTSGGGGALYGPGFASGGSMVLGGNGGVDQNQLSLNGLPIARVGRGETLSISPNQKTGGGITVNQNINVSTGVAQTVAAEFATFLPKIQAATHAAINEANMRGISA